MPKNIDDQIKDIEQFNIALLALHDRRDVLLEIVREFVDLYPHNAMTIIERKLREHNLSDDYHADLKQAYFRRK